MSTGMKIKTHQVEGLDTSLTNLSAEIAGIEVDGPAIIAGLGYTPANKAGDTFTGNVQVQTNMSPGFDLWGSSYGVNLKRASIYKTANGLAVAFRSDDAATAKNWMVVTGNSTAVTEIQVTSNEFFYNGNLYLTSVPQVNNRFMAMRDWTVLDKAVNYTLTSSDAGGLVRHISPTAHTYTIPNDASMNFAVGQALLLVNGDGGGALSIVPDSSVTLYQSGTTNTGTRTLAPNSSATILKVDANKWQIGGAG